MDVWSSLLLSKNQSKLSPDIIVCWILWNARNNRLFSNVQTTPHGIAIEIFHYMNILFSKSISRSVQAHPGRNHDVIQLQYQHHQCNDSAKITILVDGACKERKGTMGGLILQNNQPINS